MPTRKNHKVITDESDLFAELNGVAHSLLCFSSLWSGEDGAVDMPTPDTIVSTLYAFQVHIERIAEDWMILSEMYSGEITKLMLQKTKIVDCLIENMKNGIVVKGMEEILSDETKYKDTP